MEASRRDALKIGAVGFLGTAGVSALPWGASVQARRARSLARRGLPQPFQARFTRPPVLGPYKTTRDSGGRLVDHYAVTERRGTIQVLPGARSTAIWGYNGLIGGPTIKVRKGRPARLRMRNHLPSRNPLQGNEFTTSTHLHGSASLPQYDGYASDVTPPGFYKTYAYPNLQAARTLWYHDHGVHHTADNVYSGLFAQYHMHDREEMRLLPQGEFDVVLNVSDAMFRADGSLGYDDNSTSGLWGDVILVNGAPWPMMRVRRRVYRFRVLTAAISRSFRFQLADGHPVTVVATDGGLMPRAQTVTAWRQGTAERYEVLIDFRRYRPGERVLLHNLSNDNNIDFANTDVVMAFDVTDAPVDERDRTWNRIPDRLVDSRTMRLRPSMAKRTRHMRFERQGGSWTINGVTWEDVVNSNFQLLFGDPDLDDVEIWEIENKSGGWFHPVHIHLIDFKVLDRNGQPPFPWELGPKDVVYAGENEKVRLIMQFDPHVGRYMVHCHNLVHEDHDMMVQYAVGWKPGQPDPNDPILAAPCRVDNLPPDPNRLDRVG